MNTHKQNTLLQHSGIYTKKGMLQLINGLPLAIAVIDKDRKVILANRETYRFTNKNEAQLIGHVGGEAFGCIHHKDVPEGCGFGQNCLKCKLRETILNTMEMDKPHYMIETTMAFEQNGIRHLRISTNPMILNDDNVVLLSIEDITKIKDHERILIETEKLSAVIQTAGAICHEMNQPLTAILGFSELLVEEISDNDIRRSNIKEIKDQAIRLGTISGKLMTITRYRTKNYLSQKILDIEAATDDSEKAGHEQH